MNNKKEHLLNLIFINKLNTIIEKKNVIRNLLHCISPERKGKDRRREEVSAVMRGSSALRNVHLLWLWAQTVAVCSGTSWVQGEALQTGGLGHFHRAAHKTRGGGRGGGGHKDI